MKLDHLDKEEYRATGEIRATITDEELQVKAEEKLHELYDSHYEEGLKAEFLPVKEMLYLLLLKAAEIEHRVGRGKLGRKVEDLYEFMHFELKTLFVREAIIALNYFKNRSGLTFFGKINPRPKWRAPELLDFLRNMSWDLTLFRVMELMATLPGRGDFLIPYFLTFDRKMVQLFDLFPLKALLFNGKTSQMVPLWEADPLDELRKAVDIRGVEHYFGEVAGKVRLTEHQADPRPDFSALRKELEREVVLLLGY